MSEHAVEASPRRPPRRRRRRSPGGGRKAAAGNTDWVSWSVGLCAVVSCLMFGGTVGNTAFYIGCGWLLCAFHGLAVSRGWSRRDLTPAGLAFFWLTVWTAFQGLPLPVGVSAVIAPDVTAEIQSSLELIGRQGSWTPISFDPGGTLRAVVVGATATLALLAGLERRRAGRQGDVVKILAAAGIAVALVSLAHIVAGALEVYGFYEPVWPSGRPATPILNANHLGALMAFAVFPCVYLSMSADQPGFRLGWSAGALACIFVMLWTASRGAVLGLAVSSVIFGGYWLRKRRGVSRLVLGIAAFGVVVLASGADVLIRTFQESEYDKPLIAWRSMSLVLDRPLVGVGRGAFGALHNAVFGHQSRFVHPENIIAQWVTEWGVPAALLGLGAIVGDLTRRVLRSRLALWQVTLLASLAGLFAHDFVDFALEVPAIAALSALAIGATVGRRKRNRHAAKGSPRSGALVTVLGTLMLTGFIGSGASLESGVHAAQRLVTTPQTDREFRHDLERAVAAHPLEPGIFLAGGYWALRTGAADPLPWLNRTMILAPDWYQPHLLAAEYLWRRGARQQAALEWRESTMRRPTSALRRLCDLIAAGEVDEPLIRSAAPRASAARNTFLDGVTNCLSSDDPLALRLDEGRTTVAAGVRRAMRLASEDRMEEALAIIGGLEASPVVQMAKARLLLRDGRPEDALQTLSGAVPPVGSVKWLKLRAEAAALAGNDELMERSLSSLRGRLGSDSESLASVWDFHARIELRAGRVGGATRAAAEARRLRPTPERLRRLAEISEELNPGRALRLWEELCRSNGTEADCEHAAALERRVERLPFGEQPTGPLEARDRVEQDDLSQ